MIQLIHLDEPYAGFRHYVGSGPTWLRRALAAGIEGRVVRTWEGGRALERRLQRAHNAKLLCPICSGEAALNRATYKPRPVKITLSQADQTAICLSCPLASCVGPRNVRCPMQAEQKRRHRAKHERQKARGWVEKRRARRAAARLARSAGAPEPAAETNRLVN